MKPEERSHVALYTLYVASDYTHAGNHPSGASSPCICFKICSFITVSQFFYPANSEPALVDAHTVHVRAYLAGRLLAGHRIAVPHITPAHPGALAARHRWVLYDQRPFNLAPQAIAVTCQACT